MRTITRLEDLRTATRPIIIAAGAFDGVHLGHRAVIARAQRHAREAGGDAWVMTFDPHPLKVLSPGTAPAMLTSTPHKLRNLRELGIDGCAVLPFTREFSGMPPEAFLHHLRDSVPTLAAVVVGADWTFGRRATGDTNMLGAYGREHGFAVDIVAGVTDSGGEVISSTRIRRAVAEGQLDEASALLGRPFSIYGTVIHGTKMGRKLGYPTANVDPHNEVRPPAGIYACHVRVEDRTFGGAAFLTAHPDPRKGPPDLVEVHLLDMSEDLYEREIEVFFQRRLRDEWRFDTVDALIRQISIDVAAARDALRDASPPA